MSISLPCVFDAYHTWYYDSEVWTTTTWLGVPAMKSVQDLWLHQEVINDLRPGLIVECGVRFGGSTLYYASILDQIGSGTLLGVDIDLSAVDQRVTDHPRVELLEVSSNASIVAARIRSSRGDRPVFVVLDSNHSRDHVYAELETITPSLRVGDYVIVEDSNINGHPVRPGWGPGPWEAVENFIADHPDIYEHDRARESKFGWTFAPNGFLTRL